MTEKTIVRLGSIWKKWDLHIHTPSSIVHHYPTSDPWDMFLTDLNNLPPEFAAIGINDYLFVDGYRRVLSEFKSGNLPNIRAVFPVVEIRIDQLVGTVGHLSKVNLHILFEEGMDPEIIEAQFINGLSASFRLDPAKPGVTTWKGYPSRGRLEEFGRKIRESANDVHKKQYRESDLELGFNNLVVSLQGVRERLEDPLFETKALLAVGKTEWASLAWSDASIAAKKDVINGAHLVFVASASPGDYARAKSSLTTAQVNDRLLDCSDAHHLSNSSDKDRVGNCFTWIKAEPTLAGLRHTLWEFENRVYVGDEPPKLASLRNRPSDYIDRLTLRRVSNPTVTQKEYFSSCIVLNPGFVAIVGNKGKGKSALLDAIGLAANSCNEDEFTFLSKERFRHPQMNSAADYEAEIVWVSNERFLKRLEDHVAEGSVERVTYLPQQLIDTICSPDPGPPARRFAEELGGVLFAHVPTTERLGATDLQALIEIRSSAVNERLSVLRGVMTQINESIAGLERKGRKERETALEAELADLKEKVKAVEKAKPEPPMLPTETPEILELQKQIDGYKKKVRVLETDSEKLTQELSTLVTKLDAGSRLKTAIETLEAQVRSFTKDHEKEAMLLGIDLGSVIQLESRSDILNSAIAPLLERRDAIRTSLDEESDAGMPRQLQEALAEIKSLEFQLDEPGRKYAEQVGKQEEWEKARNDLLEGTPEFRGIRQVERDLKDHDAIPQKLTILYESREEKLAEIHSALMSLVAIYSDLYGPVGKFIANHELASKANLEFGASLRESNFEEDFWDFVRRDLASTFLGIEEGSARLHKLMESVNFENLEDVVAFSRRLVASLKNDLREVPSVAIELEPLLRKRRTLEGLYDLIFGLTYVVPFYMLKYSGTPIDRLSPGEKGTLLLMFYLLVDPSSRPLLLDQPDENLDNQTVKELLVPAIKEAKERRQILVITHNPNVAVVADAEQVIVADFDGDRFTYSAGALEDPTINAICVDVLEGTWPAFQNRELKYQPPPN